MNKHSHGRRAFSEKGLAVIAAAVLILATWVAPSVMADESNAGADNTGAISDGAALLAGQVLTGKSVSCDEESGEFQITLSAVARAFETTQERHEIHNVVFVLDYSQSMQATAGDTKFRDMKAAALEAINAVVLNNNDAADAATEGNQVAVVSMGAGSELLQNWTSDPINADVLNRNLSAGTENMSGLYRAYSLLKTNGRTNAIPMIVLMSDGEPNRYYKTWNDDTLALTGGLFTSAVSGDANSAYYTVRYTQAVAAKLPGLELYTIGYGLTGGAHLAKMVLDPSDAKIDALNILSADQKTALKAAGNPVTKSLDSALGAAAITDAFQRVIESVIHNDPILGHITITDRIDDAFEIVGAYAKTGGNVSVSDNLVTWRVVPTAVQSDRSLTFADVKADYASCVSTLTFRVRLTAAAESVETETVYFTNTAQWETPNGPNFATFRPLPENPFYRADDRYTPGESIRQDLPSTGRIKVTPLPVTLPPVDPDPVTLALQKCFADEAGYDADATDLTALTLTCDREEAPALICAHEHGFDCFTATERGAGDYRLSFTDAEENADTYAGYTLNEGDGDYDVTCEHGAAHDPILCYGEAHAHTAACYGYVFTFTLNDAYGNVIEEQCLSVPADEMAAYLSETATAPPVTFTLPGSKRLAEDAVYTFTETSPAYPGWTNANAGYAVVKADGTVVYADESATCATMTNTFGTSDDPGETPPIVPGDLPGGDIPGGDDDTTTPPDDTTTPPAGGGDTPNTGGGGGNGGGGDDDMTKTPDGDDTTIPPGDTTTGGGDDTTVVPPSDTTTPPTGGGTTTPPTGTTTPPTGGGNVTPPAGTTTTPPADTPDTPPAPPAPITTVAAPAPTASSNVFSRIGDALANLLGTMDISPFGVPLAGPRGAAWALLNLALTALSVVFSLILILRAFMRHKDRAEDDTPANDGAALDLAEADVSETADETPAEAPEQKRRAVHAARLFAVIASAAMIIAFVLTENVTLPMVWIDRWTLLMVVIFAVHLLFAGLTRYLRRRHDREDARKTAPETAPAPSANPAII